MALEGESVSDPIPDKPGQGFREFLGAIGSTLVLIGGELMAERDGQQFWTGATLLIAAIPVYLSGAFWKAVRDIADRAPWWLRGAFIGACVCYF